ncbi:hypothetical protein H4R34_002442 [Dimargaris verticillata]|uniref:C2 domain-containing protein n=1 Tax=Dimargaris verticillata TaxID=2761393 RepID=A0A9W8B9G8_9FUNG|nr:hypothetical protein H4R34_002442 [Dimargaris verticillata]
MSRERGQLQVYVAEGRGLPNKDLFGKSDPYLEFHLGNAAKRTRVDKKGGSAPKWKEDLYFDVPPGTQTITMRCKDRDLSSVEDIGACTIDLKRVFEEEEVHAWFKLQRKNKSAGEVYLEFTFTPVSGRKKPSLHHKLHTSMASMATLNNVAYTGYSTPGTIQHSPVPPPPNAPAPFTANAPKPTMTPHSGAPGNASMASLYPPPAVTTASPNNGNPGNASNASLPPGGGYPGNASYTSLPTNNHNGGGYPPYNASHASLPPNNGYPGNVSHASLPPAADISAPMSPPGGYPPIHSHSSGPYPPTNMPYPPSPMHSAPYPPITNASFVGGFAPPPMSPPSFPSAMPSAGPSSGTTAAPPGMVSVHPPGYDTTPMPQPSAPPLGMPSEFNGGSPPSMGFVFPPPQ